MSVSTTALILLVNRRPLTVFCSEHAGTALSDAGVNHLHGGFMGVRDFPSETLAVHSADCLSKYLFQRMQCCRVSLGTDKRRRGFILRVAAPRGGLAASRARAAAGEAQGRTAPSYEIDLESDPVASGLGVAVVSKPIMKGEVMKIVVIGGTGLIGSKVVEKLKQKEHEAIAAAPNTGVNTITGEGLQEAMAGAQVVVDLANSPSFEDKAVLEFFETSERNLLPAETAAGVRHHVALSIVGIDRTDNGYFRAKVAQEELIKASGIPYTIVRATQFLEFLGAIADLSADGNIVRLPPSLFQPIAADDVAANVAEVALAAPRNGIVEIAGPERAPFNEIVARYLKAVGDPREVVRDPEARYWGGRVEERSLVPLGEARLGRIGIDEWLRRSQAAA